MASHRILIPRSEVRSFYPLPNNMQISETSSIIGWFFGNKLRVETKETYHYKSGNDVTVTRYQDVAVSLYDKNGLDITGPDKGQNIDKKT
jgi:hypothetical protein